MRIVWVCEPASIPPHKPGHQLYVTGQPDEVNNVILATFALHAENEGRLCPIARAVPREILQKIINCLTSVVGIVAHNTAITVRCGAMRALLGSA